MVRALNRKSFSQVVFVTLGHACSIVVPKHLIDAVLRGYTSGIDRNILLPCPCHWHTQVIFSSHKNVLFIFRCHIGFIFRLADLKTCIILSLLIRGFLEIWQNSSVSGGAMLSARSVVAKHEMENCEDGGRPFLILSLHLFCFSFTDQSCSAFLLIQLCGCFGLLFLAGSPSLYIYRFFLREQLC